MKTPYLDEQIEELEWTILNSVATKSHKDELKEYKAIKKALSIHDVIERLKALRSFDVQEAGYYGQGVEEIDYENLTGDYISVKDIKKIIEELKNAL